MNVFRCFFAVLVASFFAPALHADALDDLARDFWAWRAAEMPVSTDDIPRLDRPAGWLPNWSPAAVQSYRKQVGEFEQRWNDIDASKWPVPRQVDDRLIGSAIARARWELDYLGAYQRNPTFYLDQTLGAYFHLLIEPPPFSEVRGANILATLSAFSRILTDARSNLAAPIRPFADLALDQLHDAHPRLLASVHELKPLLDPAAQKQIDTVAESAGQALDAYAQWLKEKLPSMSSQTAIGVAGYVFFLKNVALLPYFPQQLLEIGRQEWARSVAFQIYEEHRNLGAPELPMPPSVDAEIAREREDELAVRRYL